MMCFGRFGKLGHVLQRLAERGGGEREGLVVLQMRAVLALVVLLIGGRRRRGVLGIDVGGVLELRPGGQSVDLDDAGIAHVGLHAEGVTHRAGDDLQLLLVLVGERNQHDEEAHQQAHEVGEGDEPAVAAGMRLLTLCHDLCPGFVPARHQAGTGSGSCERCFSGR
jgi:hypothetical protein